MARHRRYIINIKTGRIAVEVAEATKKEHAGKWYVTDNCGIGKPELFETEELALAEYKRRKRIYQESRS